MVACAAGASQNGSGGARGDEGINGNSMGVIVRTSANGPISAARTCRRAVDTAMQSHITRRRTVGVFLVGCAFFLALMSGHIYARDEETLFQMTDGLALHGAPLVSPEVWGIVDSSAPSKHGLRPTSYAPGQPFVAVPLYWLGRAVGAAVGSSYCGLCRPVRHSHFQRLCDRRDGCAPFSLRAGARLSGAGRRRAGRLLRRRDVRAHPGPHLLRRAADGVARPARILSCCDRAPSMSTADRRRRWMLAGSGFAIGAALLVKIHAALFVPCLCSSFSLRRSDIGAPP